MAAGVGAIVLFQPDPAKSTRTYYTYGSTEQAVDGIRLIFESKLRECNPTVQNITYDLSDFYRFIDAVPDLAILVFEAHSKAFKPLGKGAIKNLVYQRLSTQQKHR